MKTLILLLLTTICFGQKTHFEFSKKEFTDYVVVVCSGKTESEMYERTLKWIEKLEAEIVEQEENEYIIFGGRTGNLVYVDYLSFRVKVTYKMGRYKFDILNIHKHQFGTWNAINMEDTSEYYNKDSELEILYNYLKEHIPNYFNKMNFSLKEYIMKEQKQAVKKEDNNW